MANSTRSALPGTVATLVAYCSGVNTCSSSPASCTSPKMPRVLTLVSTRFSEPTSRASVCISPRPLCTCSSRSATCLKLSPRRCSSVACSFSSTVARICSSFFSLPSCNAPSRVSTALRTSPRRRSLASDSVRSCSPRLSARRFNAASCASRADWLCCDSAWVAPCSASLTCCCIAASWVRNESICSFCVRATSPLCASSVCWNSDSVPASSWRVPRALSCTSARNSRSSRSASCFRPSPSAFSARLSPRRSTSHSSSTRIRPSSAGTSHSLMRGIVSGAIGASRRRAGSAAADDGGLRLIARHA